MKNVRLFYTKGGRMRFISHLDMNRFMIRIIRKSGIPIWYTEGFNPHPYITFALPLSLGFESDYEIMDLRLIDDDYPVEKLCKALNAVAPEFIRFFNAAEPVLKVGDIKFASFEIVFDDGGVSAKPLENFLGSESVICRKKTKRGSIKEFDIIPKIKASNIALLPEGTVLSITLPAGSEDNINPELLVTAFFEQNGFDYCYSVKRTGILDGDLKLFK